MRLVDVSNANYPSDNEWIAIHRDPSIGGVICKGTEGWSFHDPKLPAARLKTRMMRRVFGSYLFVSARDSGSKQALAYLDYAQPHPGDIQPIIDAEEGGLHGLSVSEMAVVTLACAVELERHGYAPILYSDWSFLRELYAAVPGLKRFRVWQAQYASQLWRIPGVRTVLWQFTDRMVVGRGRFDGSLLLTRDIQPLLIPAHVTPPKPKRPRQPRPVPAGGEPKNDTPFTRRYYTYKKDVPVGPNEVIRFQPGKGYYAAPKGSPA